MKCFNIKENKDVGVPSGFKSGTKKVSVGREEVCAITKEDKLKCWDYQRGVKKVPVEIYKSVVSDVSAGQQQNCAITKKGKLSCWPVETN